MKLKLLSVLIASSLTVGCYPIETTGPDKPTTPETEVPTPEPEPGEPIPFTAVIKSGTHKILGDVSCNGNELDVKGEITLEFDDAILCQFGNVTLAEFSPISSSEPLLYRTDENLYELTISHENKVATDNSMAVLNKIDQCPTEDTLCLDALTSFDGFDAVYADLTNQAKVNAFLGEAPVIEDELPSSHVDPTVVPAVTPGTQDDKFGQAGAFVSANVEASLAYQPTVESKVSTIASLKDNQGRALSGVQFYTQSRQGTTDENGTFEYLWGEQITFGIDTFTFGKVKGNQLAYVLSDVTENEQVKQNIQSLINRYGKVAANNAIDFNQKVHDVFALYPNVVNEIINIQLPNGAALVDDNGQSTGFTTPNEFSLQFDNGLASLIDTELYQASSYLVRGDEPAVLGVKNGTYVTDTLQAIYKDVSQFHVFHDNYSWYGATGFARGERALNLSNRAFPLTMARNDNSNWLEFGKEAAWTRGAGKDKKAYFVDATTLDATSTVTLERPMVLTQDNVTFNLPFVTAGKIGEGLVVFMGNSMYPSILSCPENYWANHELSIDAPNQSCSYTKGKEAQAQDTRNDKGDMQRFFANMFAWMVPELGGSPMTIGTNIETAHAMFTSPQNGIGRQYPFFVNPAYGFSQAPTYGTGQYGSLDPKSVPIMIMQGYEQVASGYDTKAIQANIDAPSLTQQDVSDLIAYASKGGNLIFMEAIAPRNPEPIARLSDAAGIVLGGGNMVATRQAHCGSGYFCTGDSPNMHAQLTNGLVVYERYDDTSKIEINDNGSITWPKPIDMPSLSVARFKDDNGEAKGPYAFFSVNTAEEKQAAIAKIQAEFPGVPVCKDDYPYEVNCIESRDGHGIPTRGTYARPDFTRLPMSPDVVSAMVKAANMGDNITVLMNHELYYRTKAAQGTRIANHELNAIYDNLSIWLWNDEQYAFVDGVQDELGFKTLTEYLNCYTNDKHGGGSTCPEELKNTLSVNNMVTASGELAPSYPLNYMEKPLTRIMLGRSYWDYDITVDTRRYPGRPQATGSNVDVEIQTYRNTVSYSAGNRQPTGLWAPQLEDVAVSGGAPGTITVALVDDLTGRATHEVALNRPPRVEKSFKYDGNALTFQVPYGGLIYINPNSTPVLNVETYRFSNVIKASLWKDGKWVNSVNPDVPLADIDTGHFVYTTPVKNVNDSRGIATFAQQMNHFANAASDFYGRDETTQEGKHRRFTDAELPEHRHHFVNDVQISIGAAHSGYPVQSSSFNPESNNLPTHADDDWLLWHEVGHNLASAPFSLPGGTEVTNNILALYMQELRTENPTMSRISSDIEKIPFWMDKHEGHAWSEGNPGLRLVMFGQLKLWAEDNFDITQWYDEKVIPSVFDADQGWNMIKLMHRLTRGETFGDTNYCSSSALNLNASDTLMVCASYASGYDLSDFFSAWNPGETKADLPDGSSNYSGGITAQGKVVISTMMLKTPEKSPLLYIAL